jgi:hypothetical protein
MILVIVLVVSFYLFWCTVISVGLYIRPVVSSMVDYAARHWVVFGMLLIDEIGSFDSGRYMI